MNLRNKNILITGVGKGLGKSMVEYFLKSGHKYMELQDINKTIKNLKKKKNLRYFTETLETYLQLKKY